MHGAAGETRGNSGVDSCDLLRNSECGSRDRQTGNCNTCGNTVIEGD